ncbi:hypothetical protein VQ02_21895 [Methylobacterium variabile]|uniref:DUF2946 domain-containing protein n=1 Tax=Methylobacterium variabile TaxID=298794 RepID=A0A0J6SHF8_9HYPH|nr:hypothetical protein VQ02_21895 [Methylobacterium variabile]
MTHVATSTSPRSDRRDAVAWWRALVRSVAVVLALLLALPVPETPAGETPVHQALHLTLVVADADHDGAPDNGHVAHCACRQAVTPETAPPMPVATLVTGVRYAWFDDVVHVRTTVPPLKPPRA